MIHAGCTTRQSAQQYTSGYIHTFTQTLTTVSVTMGQQTPTDGAGRNQLRLKFIWPVYGRSDLLYLVCVLRLVRVHAVKESDVMA